MEKRKKVIITERMDEQGVELLKEGLDVDIAFHISREELLEKIHEYDAIIVRSVTKVDKELISAGTNLKVIGRAGNGLDNIEIEEATKRGIIVANTPDSNTMSAAELTIAHLLVQSRNVVQANNYIKSGKWARNPFKGVELYKKTLGIIGLGRIGSLVASRMNAFGMKIIAYDPYIPDERFERFNAEKKDTLEELLKEADFITVHTPKTKETIGMIDEEELELLKDGARLCNVARGGIISEKALIKGLESGKIASAGIDVFEIEPCPDNPLFKFDNIVATPHLGASTTEAQQNVGTSIAKQVISALKGEIVPNAVNLPTLHRDELEAVQPYINLMEKLGKIYYQLYQEPIEYINIDYWGRLSKKDSEMTTIAFVKGLLEPVVENRVNYVNAMLLADQRGIGVETKTNAEAYNGYMDYVEIKIQNKKGSFVLAGSLSSRREGRIVKIDNYDIDMNPSQYMLLVKNMDVPGVVGNVGKIMGQQNINIDTMQVGRDERGKEAMMVLNIDDEVPVEILEKLGQFENIIWAKMIKL